MPQPQPLLKPIRPQINFGNPISHGLVFDAPFWEGAGQFVEDDAFPLTEILGTLTSATWDKNFYGTDLDFSAAASVVSFIPPSIVNDLSQLTIEALVYPRTTGAGGFGRILHKGEPSGNTTQYFSIFTDSADHVGHNLWAFYSTWTTNQGQWVSTADMNLNAWQHIIFTYDFSSTGNNPLMYLNGIPNALTQDQIPGGSAPTDTDILYIGNRGTATRNFDGKISYVRLWNRIVTPTEVFSLYINPWQIYQTPSFRNLYNSNFIVTSTIPTGFLTPNTNFWGI